MEAYSVIIPTRNAEKYIDGLVTALRSQSVPPARILVVDTESEDRTLDICHRMGVETISVKKADFDHGGTRDMAFRMTDTPFVVFLTQDALPARSHSVENLLKGFETDPMLAIIGGRQIAHDSARPHEKLVRLHNYPAQSRVWDQSQCSELGVRAYLISDVFAAYRREAYLAVGGFDRPVMTNEDMLITQKLLEAGYRAGYCGDAWVFHSHDFTWREQYRRNYTVGRIMIRYASRFRNAQEISEGMSLFTNISGQLLRAGRIGSFISFCWDCSARFLGNRMGRLAEKKRLPDEKG